MKKLTAILSAAVILGASGLSGCVTNEEPALPEGWAAPDVDEVPDIAAMYQDADGVLTVGTNPPLRALSV